MTEKRKKWFKKEEH